jgi:hypothetical protein
MSVVMNIRVIYLKREISWKNTRLTTSRDELHVLRMFTDAVPDTRIIKYGVTKNIFVKYDFDVKTSLKLFQYRSRKR